MNAKIAKQKIFKDSGKSDYCTYPTAVYEGGVDKRNG
jgi:hypothetical protein